MIAHGDGTVRDGDEAMARQVSTYGNSVRVLLADALGLSLALLELVLVLKLAAHLVGGWWW